MAKKNNSKTQSPFNPQRKWGGPAISISAQNFQPPFNPQRKWGGPATQSKIREWRLQHVEKLRQLENIQSEYMHSTVRLAGPGVCY